MCDFSRVSAWFCDEKFSLKKSCFYLYIRMADGFEMTAIAICVLGGVSITGGKGRMDGVAIGALIMSVVTYFISMIPGMSVWQKALQGGIIIVAVAINYFTEQSAKRQALKERSALI